MQLKKMNLNLLLTLQALLHERNVTRASQKCCVTQSATSIALNQLREIFNDPLLERYGQGMRLTPKAKTLIEPLDALLKEAENLISPKAFDPQTTEITFRVGMSDYIEWVLLPLLLPELKKRAPHVKLKIINLTALDHHRMFIDQSLDLGIGVVFNQFNHVELSEKNIWQDIGCCVGAKNHPLLRKKITMSQFLNAEQVSVVYVEEPFLGHLDQTLKKFNTARNTKIAVPHMSTALIMAAQTDLLLATTYYSVQQVLKPLKLACQPLPFKTPIVQVKQAWLNRFTHSQEHCWLRDLIDEVCEKMILKMRY